MSKFLLIQVVLLLSAQASSQITTNVFTRVVHLRVNAGTAQEGEATGFTIGVDGRQYLLTAKHVVSKMGDDGVIGIEQSSKWVDVPVKILRCDDPVDIAVLIAPSQITLGLALPFEPNNILYGQDVYFLGFPYNLGGPGGMNGGFPLPLVKRGLLSAYNKIGDGANGAMILLDGYNNPGFSGGPVVYRDPNQSNVTFDVVAVISGFRPEMSPVVREHNIPSIDKAAETSRLQPWRIQRRQDGSLFEYLDTGDSVSLNTGIVYSYLVTPAIALIRKHPIGPEEKQLPAAPSLK